MRLLSVVAVAAATLLGGCAFVRPITVSSTGEQANGGIAAGPSISFDGRYAAYWETASNLVPGDTNNSRDVFVRDLVNGTTERVSVATGGAQANGDSVDPTLDYAGRMVVFSSEATDLVEGDTNGVKDVFVHDRETGETSRVSVDSDGTEANALSSMNSLPTISGNGRFVAFISHATNLVPGDTNGAPDAFVHDLATGTTEIVSVSSTGEHGNFWTGGHVSISENGRFVGFDSASTNLVPGDTNSHNDVFVHDRRSGHTTLVSVATDGTQGNAHVNSHHISGNGRYVTFQSIASNIVAGDTNGARDIFVHDRRTGETERVNIASDGSQATGTSPSRFLNASISFDGRFVTFDEYATNLVPGDTNGSPDTFVHDRATGRTARVSLAADGTQSNGFNGNHMISGDGRYVVFGTVASNLFDGDTNGSYDIIVAATMRPDIESVEPVTLQRGARNVRVEIRGGWFTPDAFVSLGPDVEVTRARLVDLETLQLTVDVPAAATLGPLTVLVANPGTGPGVLAGAADTCAGCISVTS